MNFFKNLFKNAPISKQNDAPIYEQNKAPTSNQKNMLDIQYDFLLLALNRFKKYESGYYINNNKDKERITELVYKRSWPINKEQKKEINIKIHVEARTLEQHRKILNKPLSEIRDAVYRGLEPIHFKYQVSEFIVHDSKMDISLCHNITDFYCAYYKCCLECKVEPSLKQFYYDVKRMNGHWMNYYIVDLPSYKEIITFPQNVLKTHLVKIPSIIPSQVYYEYQPKIEKVIKVEKLKDLKNYMDKRDIHNSDFKIKENVITYHYEDNSPYGDGEWTDGGIWR